jgi:hypothetical protein
MMHASSALYRFNITVAFVPLIQVAAHEQATRAAQAIRKPLRLLLF